MHGGPVSAIRKGFEPDGIPVRILDGQRIYWHVLSVEGARKMIFVSGQVPRGMDGRPVCPGDMAGQIRHIGENIKKCLEAAGATLGDLVRIVCYTTDIDEFHRHASVRNEYFGKALPPSTAIEVRRLGHPDWLIEIEATAMV